MIVVLSIFMTTACFIAMIVLMTVNSISTLELYFHGVRTTGTAVSSRSVEQSENGLRYYTEISFVGGGERRVEEIVGEYAEGEEIPIVYDPDDPSVVDSESEVGLGGVLATVLPEGIILALFALWIGLFR
ncbi:DUF3592 domain-containing protein [Streptosporangium sp. NPDC051023]|uniref:DUF3592 domain-containing protein n=1 Tax=Streptosporangium sp. NPDC051023 TaxID=3155410 RepID=UPI00344B7310